MRRFFAAILALIVVIPIPSAMAGDTREEKLERLLLGFLDSALWGGNRHTEPMPPSRWTQPIRLRVDRDPDDDIARFAEETVKRLADVAGVAVEVLPRGDNTENFLVTFVDTDTLLVGGELVSCVAHYDTKAGSIRRINLKINLNYKYVFRRTRCVRHETLHGMGLIAHPHSLDSILSYVYSARDEYSADDFDMLKLLYDADLKPGAFHLAALLQAREILARQLGVQNDVAQFGRAVFDKELERMKAAIDAGNSAMMVQLGYAYANGQYVAKDSGQALELYRKAAEAGNSEGMFKLAYAHHKGDGTTVNFAEALRLYRQASGMGHALARNNLAVLVRDGHGTAADPVEAWVLFDSAAKLGNKLAAENRETLAAKLTPEQLATAQSMAQASP